MLRYRSFALLALCVFLLSACGASTSQEATSLDNTAVVKDMHVAVNAVHNGGSIPVAYTCSGAGVEPTISWGGVPAFTKSVAVVVVDTDTQKGPFVQWIVTGLPALAGSVPNHGSGVDELDNTGGTHGWAPLCPAAGATNQYRFTVYALDDYVCATGGTGIGSAGCSPPASSQALSQIRDDAIGEGTVVGTFHR